MTWFSAQWGNRRNSLLKEWDEKKVQAMIISHLVPRQSNSYEAQLLRELRRYSLPIPAILDPLVREIHKIYVKEMGGDDLERRVAEVKKLFDQIKDHVTEDDVLQWFRETHVRKVMES